MIRATMLPCRPLACALLLACGAAGPPTPAAPAPSADSPQAVHAAQPAPVALAATAAASARPAAARGAPAPPAPPQPPTLLVNGVLNSGFEWVADATTEPPKLGAYWLGSFVPKAGDATSFVVEDRPWRDGHALRLSHLTGEVLQKIVADPRFTGSLVVTAAVRTARDGLLQLALEDGQDRRTTVRIRSDERGLRVTDDAGGAL